MSLIIMQHANTKKLRLYAHFKLCLILKRFKKQFASLHNQDRRLFCFPNTTLESISIPIGIKSCSSLDEFKIKGLKGGFQRRPELIVNCVDDPSFNSFQTLEERLLSFTSGRISKNTQRIQEELVEKAICLVQSIRIVSHANFTCNLNKLQQHNNTQLVLDIGCGCGTSAMPLLNLGYSFVGVDLNVQSLSQFKRYLQSKSLAFYDLVHNYSCETNLGVDNGNLYNFRFLEDSQNEEDVNNHKTTSQSTLFTDFVRWDLRYGLPFREHTFDLVISISFLQWLFYGERQRQLNMFFSSLKSVLQPRRTAVIQFYPRSSSQLQDAVQSAMKYFQGVVVGDYPHIDRGRKLFLLLFS